MKDVTKSRPAADAAGVEDRRTSTDKPARKGRGSFFMGMFAFRTDPPPKPRVFAAERNQSKK
jgi:hypothetical protein